MDWMRRRLAHLERERIAREALEARILFWTMLLFFAGVVCSVTALWLTLTG